MQPDREDAERDDAAVEVAAHGFFCAVCARASPVVFFDDVELEYPPDGPVVFFAVLVQWWHFWP